MKKLLFVLVALIVGGARADNIVTSREYVDGQANTLQSELPAKNENTVLLNTDTAGEVGEKAIYDASAAFSTQTDALVTAGQFNTAVQNALESEFVCIERQNGDGGCLLYEIRAPYQKSKNLFNIKNIPDSPYIVSRSDNSFTINLTGVFSLYTTKLKKLAPDLVAGKTYTLSFKSTGARTIYLDGSGANVYWRPGSNKTLTQEMLNANVLFYANGSGTSATISNIQIEEGTVATSYAPYGNVYLSSGN